MKATGCQLCKFVSADTRQSGCPYLCTNQDSPNFGKPTVDGCEEYERFRATPDMSFKEALECVVLPSDGTYTYWRFLFDGKDELNNPYYCISFADNKQMHRYRDALSVCFDMLMKLKEEAGDFDGEDGDGDGE